jgi:RNA polymerase sigma factor (sigma-70 family)
VTDAMGLRASGRLQPHAATTNPVDRSQPAPVVDQGGGRPDAAVAYRTLGTAVLAYLRAQRAPEPDDLLGEVFLQVARDIRRFRGDDEGLRRWVFSIARHRLIDDRRRRRVRPVTSGDDPPEQSIDVAFDGMDPELTAALATLTPEQREVIVLRFVADLSLVDVARVTRRRVNAVKALQHRGLEALERRLGERPCDG